MARRAASAAACSSSAGIAIHFVFSPVIQNDKDIRKNDTGMNPRPRVLFVVDLGGSPTVWIYRVGSLVPDCDSSSPIGYFMMTYKH